MRLRNPIAAHGGAAYFEGWRRDRTLLFRLDENGPAVEIATLAGHGHGTLIAVEDDGLVCRTTDDTLVVVALDGVRRHALCRLSPAPEGAAVVATPEHVVWCSATRVHRWWRDSARVDDLGEHGARYPLLAVRPTPRPYPPERLSADVAIAAGTQLGLIDAEELDWLVTLDEEPMHLACDVDALYAVTPDELVRFDLDTDALTRLYERRHGAPPIGIAARDGVAYLATNASRDGNARLIRFEGAVATTLAGTTDDTWLRAGRQLAVTPRGLLVTEDASLANGVDRVTFVPHDARKADASATLQWQRWAASGAGAQVIVENGAWHSGMASNELSASCVARIDAWVREQAGSANHAALVPGIAGRQVQIGGYSWYASDLDVTDAAQAIDAFAAIVAGEIPFVG
jgi:hypothetical protein